MIIPKEMKKGIQIKGIPLTNVIVLVSPFLILPNLKSMGLIKEVSILTYVSSIILLFLFLLPFNQKPFYFTFLNNIKYRFEKKLFFKNRDIMIQDKYSFQKKKYNGRNPFKKINLLISNFFNEVVLSFKKRIYLFVNRNQTDIDNSILKSFEYEITDFGLIITRDENKYLVKKLIPTHSKFFNNEEEVEHFYRSYYRFLYANPNIRIYKFENLPSGLEEYYEKTTEHKFANEFFKLENQKYYDYHYGDIPYYYTVEHYDENIEYPTTTYDILKHTSISADEIYGIQTQLFNNIEYINSLEFDEHTLICNGEGYTDYIRFLQIDDLSVNQVELYLEQLITVDGMVVMIDFQHCDQVEMKSVIDNSVIEAVSRLNESDRVSTHTAEAQEIEKLKSYSQALNDETDIMVKFNIVIRLLSKNKKQLDLNTKILLEAFPNLKIKYNLFTQQQSFKRWNLITNSKSEKYKYLSLTDFAMGGLFNFNLVDHQHGNIIYQKADGLVKFDFLRRDLQDYQQKARHSLTTGQTGSGKSFFAKYRIVSNALNGCTIYNLDLQGDYIRLFEEMGGQNIIMSEGYKINPLEILNYSQSTIEDHISNLAGFFLSANEDKVESILDSLLVHLYNFYNDKYQHVVKEKVSAEEYPTFRELHDYLIEIDCEETIIEFIHKYAYTIYAKYFNGITNVDIDNHLVNFVIFGTDDIIINTIYHQVFSIMTSAIYSEKEDDLVIEFDEAHNLMRNNYSTAFLIKTIKEARKYSTIINLMTQMIDDIPESVYSQVSIKYFFRQSNMETVAKILDRDIETLPNLAFSEDGAGIVEFDKSIYPINIHLDSAQAKKHSYLLNVFASKYE